MEQGGGHGMDASDTPAFPGHDGAAAEALRAQPLNGVRILAALAAAMDAHRCRDPQRQTVRE